MSNDPSWKVTDLPHPLGEFTTALGSRFTNPDPPDAASGGMVNAAVVTQVEGAAGSNPTNNLFLDSLLVRLGFKSYDDSAVTGYAGATGVELDLAIDGNGNTIHHLNGYYVVPILGGVTPGGVSGHINELYGFVSDTMQGNANSTGLTIDQAFGIWAKRPSNGANANVTIYTQYSLVSEPGTLIKTKYGTSKAWLGIADVTSGEVIWQRINGTSLEFCTTAGTVLATLSNTGVFAPSSLKVAEILDTNGAVVLKLNPVASANNYLEAQNSNNARVGFAAKGSNTNVGIFLRPKGAENVAIYTDTGITPTLSAAGVDTNLDLNLASKGTGIVRVNSIPVVDTTSAQTLAGKTLTSPVINNPTGITKSDVGLSNVDNTSNATERAATAALTNKDLTSGTNTFPTFNQNTSGTASNVTGTVAVGNGGTGAITLTGLVKGTGTTAMVSATAGTDYVAPGGALGTPSSATLTNATGLPLAGLTAGAYASAATASVLAQRDANANLIANAHLSTATTNATSSTTFTLTVASAEIQIFTGSSQICVLPTTNIVAGQRFTVIGGVGAGTVNVQASNTTAIASVPTGQLATFTALQATPTTPAHWLYSSGAGFSFRQTATAAGVAVRDANANLVSANFIPATTSTATAAGTTTLTIASNQVQVFTGATTQTVKLPTTSVTAGMEYRIINNSSGSVTVQSSAANTIATVTANTLQLFIAQIDTPTTAANWRAI